MIYNVIDSGVQEHARSVAIAATRRTDLNDKSETISCLLSSYSRRHARTLQRDTTNNNSMSLLFNV